MAKIFWLMLRYMTLGFLVGGIAYFVLLEIPIGRWRFLARPPSNAVKILRVIPGYIYVQAADNKVYACDIHATSVCIPDAALSDTDGVWWWDCKDSAPLPIMFPLPPSMSIDAFRIYCEGPDGYMDTQWAILGDGSIWVWFTGGSGEIAENILILFCIIGAIIGPLIGVIAAGIQQKDPPPLHHP